MMKGGSLYASELVYFTKDGGFECNCCGTTNDVMDSKIKEHFERHFREALGLRTRDGCARTYKN